MGINVELIRGDFKNEVFNCAVCQDLFNDPVTIKGCHTFCRSCLPDAGPYGTKNCPVCRKEFMNGDLEPPTLFMKQTLAEIKLQCSFDECGKIVTYDLFGYHKVLRI